MCAHGLVCWGTHKEVRGHVCGVRSLLFYWGSGIELRSPDLHESATCSAISHPKCSHSRSLGGGVDLHPRSGVLVRGDMRKSTVRS